MTIIHRYIFKELFFWFVMLVALAAVIFLAKELHDTRDEILDYKTSFVDVAEYVIVSIPSQLLDAIPLIVLFSVLFAIGLLARHREILAMVSLGISFRRLSIPVWLFGIAVSLLVFWFAEWVAPQAQSRARFIYSVRIKGKNQYAFTTEKEIFRKGKGNRFFIMSNYDQENKVMIRPSILDRSSDGSGLSQRIEADRARLVQEGGAGPSIWEFEGMERWSFNEDGSVSIEKFDVPYRIQLDEKLDSFLSRDKKPTEMNIAELRDYCDILRQQGGTAALARYRTSIQAKIALPVSCLLLALMAFAICADLRNRRFILVFSAGLVFGVFYYLLREGAVGLGQRGLLHPVIAAWSPVVIYAGLVVRLFYRLTGAN